MKSYWLLSLGWLVLFSCTKSQNVPYEFIVFKDKELKVWHENLQASMIESLENGYQTIRTEDNTVISEGLFDQGFKKGLWKYYPNSGKASSVEWTFHRDSTHHFEMNYPTDWKVIPGKERPFQAVFPRDPIDSLEGCLFVVQEIRQDSINASLEEYQNSYQYQSFKRKDIKDYSNTVFLTGSGRTFYLFNYLITERSQEMVALAFLGELDGKIFDFTYVSQNVGADLKLVVLLDIVRSVRVNGVRFFSPLDPINKYYKPEIPDTVRKAS